MLKDTPTSYGFITKLFHWTIGPIIIGLLIVGFVMANMEPSPEKYQLYPIHKAIGVTVLFLVTLRSLWRLSNGMVQLPPDIPAIIKICANITHFLQYVFMFLMPISGMLMSLYGGREISLFDLFIIPAFEKNDELADLFYNIHAKAAWLFVGTISLHILAALYHHFIRRDNILMRMIK